MVGTHYQKDSMRAADGSSAVSGSGIGSFYNVNWRRRSDAPGGRHSITDFETFPNAARCNEPGFDCQVSDYASGAPRDLNEAGYNRYHSSVIVSYLANLWGHHLIKVGFDGELTSFRNQKSNRVFTESEDGSQFNDEERFGRLVAPDTVEFIDPLTKRTQSLTLGGFIQDSWSVFDKVTVNLGVRYDSQLFFNTAGDVGLSLPNQWSPRFGFIYDPTQTGRAKLFFNYARYYENAPLSFADVVLVGEPQVRGGHVCNPINFAEHRNQCQDSANLRPNTQSDPRLPNRIFTGGGAAGALDPDIEASSSDELSAGGEYELLPDARLGLTLTRRWINKWIEDMNPVVGLNGFAGNPGYGLGSAFPRAQRDYHAATVFLAKNFSRSWLAQASYTLGSLKGNYSGLFAPEDGYLGPNGTADFDSPNVSNNRYGPLKGDFRHNVKVMGAKDWRITNRQGLGTGLSLRARSGSPTSYLGADPYTYSLESYLVRAGGRRAAALDLHRRPAAGLPGVDDQQHRRVGDGRRVQPVQLPAGHLDRRGVHDRQRDRHRGLQGGGPAKPDQRRGQGGGEAAGLRPAHVLPGATGVSLRPAGGILMFTRQVRSMRSMRSVMKPAGNLVALVSLLALVGCDATQPRPLCRAQQSKYAARYTVTGTPSAGCEGKVLTGEILNLQYYRPKQNEPNGTPSVAIEADSVFQAVQAAAKMMMATQGQEFSQGPFDGYEPAADDICRAAQLSETNITAGPTQLGYKWSNLQMLVKPLANSTHFGADLVRRDGACTVPYKVSAAYPAVYCGTGTKTVMNEMGMMVTEPDPTTGRPDPKLCEAVTGNGINPDFDLVCDASADGMSGTHLCVPRNDFPSLRK